MSWKSSYGDEIRGPYETIPIVSATDHENTQYEACGREGEVRRSEVEGGGVRSPKKKRKFQKTSDVESVEVWGAWEKEGESEMVVEVSLGGTSQRAFAYGRSQLHPLPPFATTFCSVAYRFSQLPTRASLPI